MPFEEVSALLSPLSGKEISLGELVQQVDKITQLYRDRGYPLSFALVQNQSFANGLVVVTVVEGHIGSVRINGDLGMPGPPRIAGAAAERGKPLRQATLERVLNLMRTVPGVTFTPSLDLPRRADGATELVLEAARQPVSLTGGVADLGGHAAAGQRRHQQPDAPGRTGETDGRTALPVGRRQNIMGEVRVPIGSDGLAVKVDGYHYDARPKDDSIEYLGFQRHVRNDRIGIGLSYPFLLNNTRSLTGTLGYTRPIPKIATKPTTATAGCNRTRVRAVNAELRYIQLSESMATDVTLGVAKGFDAAGAKRKSRPITGFPRCRSWTWISSDST